MGGSTYPGYPNDQANPASAVPVWIAPPPGMKNANITTDTGTLLKTGKGTLLGISVNTPASGATITVYDGIDNTGTVIGIYPATAAGMVALPSYGVAFVTGLYVVTAVGAANVTVYYQ